MKLAADQLHRHLEKNLAPIYFISGEEPLIKQESCDAIRQSAKAAGYTERETLQANAGFDWQQLLSIGNNLSLFSHKRIIELTFSGKPGQAGAKILRAYAEKPPVDTLLLLISNKLEGNAINSAWVKALDKVGIVIQVWPINQQQFPRWLQQRLHQAKINVNPPGIELLCQFMEGNLLAAQQAILKLQLIHGENTSALTEHDIANAMSDHSQYDVFQLVDSALAGDAPRTTMILQHLHSTKLEPILILWGLAREIRSLLSISVDQSQIQTVWKQRQGLVRSALQRLNYPTLIHMQQDAAKIDRMLKGANDGHVNDALLSLSLRLAGKPLLCEQAIS